MSDQENLEATEVASSKGEMSPKGPPTSISRTCVYAGLCAVAGIVLIVALVVTLRRERIDQDMLTSQNTTSTTTTATSTGATPSPPLPFPGLTDAATAVACCPARILVELERRYSAGRPLSFSTLLWNHSGPLQAVEIYENCCRLPPSIQDSYAELTLAEWVTHCILTDEDPASDESLVSFVYYYNMTETLIWNRRSCQEVAEGRRETADDIVRNVSLVDGEYTGMVSVLKKMDYEETSIYIPDVESNSCWIVSCSRNNLDTDTCVQNTMENLVDVSLEDFVEALKPAGCG